MCNTNIGQAGKLEIPKEMLECLNRDAGADGFYPVLMDNYEDIKRACSFRFIVHRRAINRKRCTRLFSNII